MHHLFVDSEQKKEILITTMLTSHHRALTHPPPSGAGSENFFAPQIRADKIKKLKKSYETSRKKMTLCMTEQQKAMVCSLKMSKQFCDGIQNAVNESTGIPCTVGGGCEIL